MAGKNKSAAKAATVTEGKMRVQFIKRDKDKNLDLSKALESINSGSGQTIQLPAGEAQADPFELDLADGLKLISEYPFLYKELTK